jgi:hypothetical protein
LKVKLIRDGDEGWVVVDNLDEAYFVDFRDAQRYVRELRFR